MISSDYLQQDLDKYELIRNKLEQAYEQVINSLIDKSILPYRPNLYPIAFMIIKRYGVGFYLSNVMFYSLIYPDVKDFQKFAIYINLSLIIKYPNYLH